MQRDLAGLTNENFDVVVIGGGIYGACIARDAAYRGLSVALVERGDFGHATSHNSLRLIHGGLRYLQHLDFRRVRQSIGEQNFWLRAAPHIVRPLKFVMPTYGLGTRGPAALWAGTQLYRLLAYDRNRGVDESSRIPAGGVISRQALADTVPGLRGSDINGGAVWYDAQILDPDRLIMEVLQDAESKGARPVNYVEAMGFLRQGNKISGIRAYDHVGGAEIEIMGNMTICSSGPWTGTLTGEVHSPNESVAPILTKGMNIVTRPLGPHVAFGVRSARRSDAVVGKSQRMYFATPAAGCTVIGTTHFPYSGSPDDCEFTEEEVAEFLDEFNAAYPDAELGMEDVYYWHGGLTPAEDGDGDEVIRGHQAEIIDHNSKDQVEGLISVIGVKYTTSRLVAENAVDLIYKKNGSRPPECAARNAQLPGAQPHDPDSRFPTYGSNAERLESLAPDIDDHAKSTFVARCRYALQNEMAVHLDDLIIRRTMQARQGQLSEQLFDEAAELMAGHFDWNDAEKQMEIDNTRARLAEHGVFLAR